MNVSLQFDWKRYVHSPSRKDGISDHVERYFRCDSCKFIDEFGQHLQMPGKIRLLACGIFQLYYLQCSFKRVNRYESAIACIILSSKIVNCVQPQHIQRITYSACKFLHKQAIKNQNTFQHKSQPYLINGEWNIILMNYWITKLAKIERDIFFRMHTETRICTTTNFFNPKNLVGLVLRSPSKKELGRSILIQFQKICLYYSLIAFRSVICTFYPQSWIGAACMVLALEEWNTRAKEYQLKYSVLLQYLSSIAKSNSLTPKNSQESESPMDVNQITRDSIFQELQEKNEMKENTNSKACNTNEVLMKIKMFSIQLQLQTNWWKNDNFVFENDSNSSDSDSELSLTLNIVRFICDEINACNPNRMSLKNYCRLPAEIGGICDISIMKRKKLLKNTKFNLLPFSIQNNIREIMHLNENEMIDFRHRRLVAHKMDHLLFNHKTRNETKNEKMERLQSWMFNNEPQPIQSKAQNITYVNNNKNDDIPDYFITNVEENGILRNKKFDGNVAHQAQYRPSIQNSSTIKTLKEYRNELPSTLDKMQIEIYPYEEYDVTKLKYNPKSEINHELHSHYSNYETLSMQFDYERGTCEQGYFFECIQDLETYEVPNEKELGTETLIIDGNEMGNDQYLDSEQFCTNVELFYYVANKFTLFFTSENGYGKDWFCAEAKI